MFFSDKPHDWFTIGSGLYFHQPVHIFWLSEQSPLASSDLEVPCYSKFSDILNTELDIMCFEGMVLPGMVNLSDCQSDPQLTVYW